MTNLSKSFRTFIIGTMELYLTTSGRMNGSLSHFLGTQIPVPVFFLFSLPRHRPFAYPVCVAARKPRFRPGNPSRHRQIGTSVCVATGGAGTIHCQKDDHQQDSHHCSGNCRHLWNPTFFLSRRGQKDFVKQLTNNDLNNNPSQKRPSAAKPTRLQWRNL